MPAANSNSKNLEPQLARLTEILIIETHVSQFLLCNTSLAFNKNYKVY